MYRIGEIRRSKGLRQNYVADKIGVTQQHLSDIERGKHDPRGEVLFKLAEVLECKVDDFRIKKEGE